MGRKHESHFQRNKGHALRRNLVLTSYDSFVNVTNTLVIVTNTLMFATYALRMDPLLREAPQIGKTAHGFHAFEKIKR
jgi:hypothetical protein